MMYDGWMWGNGWGWTGWILMTVFMVVLWAALITSVVVAVRYLAGSRHTPGGPASSGLPPPEDVLAGRFARGEIDEDEYRRRMAALREHR